MDVRPKANVSKMPAARGTSPRSSAASPPSAPVSGAALNQDLLDQARRINEQTHTRLTQLTTPPRALQPQELQKVVALLSTAITKLQNLLDRAARSQATRPAAETINSLLRDIVTARGVYASGQVDTNRLQQQQWLTQYQANVAGAQQMYQTHSQFQQRVTTVFNNGSPGAAGMAPPPPMMPASPPPQAPPPMAAPMPPRPMPMPPAPPPPGFVSPYPAQRWNTGTMPSWPPYTSSAPPVAWTPSSTGYGKQTWTPSLPPPIPSQRTSVPSQRSSAPPPAAGQRTNVSAPAPAPSAPPKPS